MRFLLDTHTFLWYIGAHPKLSQADRRQISDLQNTPVLSIASPWELAIKASIGKFKLERTFADLIALKVLGNGIELLDITAAHLDTLATLPLHHRDPFDRLIVAQALSEGIPVMSVDEAFDDYSATRPWSARKTDTDSAT